MGEIIQTRYSMIYELLKTNNITDAEMDNIFKLYVNNEIKDIDEKYIDWDEINNVNWKDLSLLEIQNIINIIKI